MPLNTRPVESVYTAICSHEESSTREEGAFFSVAMTTPSLAAGAEGAGGGWGKGGRGPVRRRRRRGERAPQTAGAPWIPKLVFPRCTAFSACSICSSLPEGLKVVRENA